MGQKRTWKITLKEGLKGEIWGCLKAEGKDLVGRTTFKIQEKRWRCQVSRSRSDEPERWRISTEWGCKAVKMTARVKGKVRRGEKLNLLASIFSVEQEMKSFMKEVKRGKEGWTFFWGKGLHNCCGKCKKRTDYGTSQGTGQTFCLVEVDTRQNGYVIFSIKHGRPDVEKEADAYLCCDLR